jgi:alcohol dehydrogenase
VDPTAEDPVMAIRERTGGVDVSVDALGIAETCRNSVRCLRERGTHAQIGLTTDEARGELSLPTDWMTRWEITFVGSRGMPPTRYTALFEFLAASDIDPGELVARELALDEVSDRLAAMSEYDTDGVEVITEF